MNISHKQDQGLCTAEVEEILHNIQDTKKTLWCLQDIRFAAETKTLSHTSPD